MIANTLTILPMLVSVFWLLILTDDWFLMRSRAKARIAMFAAACTILYSAHIIYFNHYYALLPVSDTLYATAQLSVFPLYAMYIKEVTHDTTKLHWMPIPVMAATVVAVAIITGILYALMTPEQTHTFIAEYLYHDNTEKLNGIILAQAIMHKAAHLIFALQAIFTLIYGAKRIRLHNQQVADYYADTFGRCVNHPQLTFAVFIITCILALTALTIGRHTFCNHPWLLAMPSLSFSTLIFLLCHDAHRMTMTTFEPKTAIVHLPHSEGLTENTASTSDDNTVEIHNEEQYTEKANDSSSTSEGNKGEGTVGTSTIDKLRTKIQQLMEEERLYLQPDLKITDLTGRLNTNRDYTQQAIKRMEQGSFSEYINRLRIEHACNLLRNNPKIALIDLINACGYSSHASFYRNFKQFAGMSPTAYIEKI